MIAIAAALLLAAAAGSTSTSTTRVAVLPLAEDAASEGRLAHDVETRLRATPGISVRDAAALAPADAPLDAPAADAALLQTTGKLFDTVETAFAEDRIPDALAGLARIAAMQDGATHVRAPDRVRLCLWRAAVFLAGNDRASATTAAHDALVIDPALTVDLKVFPPPVKSLVEQVRARGLGSIRVTLTGLPRDASITVDDRPVKPTFTVPPGHHAIVATAPGRRAVESRLDLATDATLSLSLPALVGPADRAAAQAFLWTDGAPAALRAAASHAGVDVIVVAGSRGGELRARIWRADSAAAPIAATSSDALARAVGDALRPAETSRAVRVLPHLPRVPAGTWMRAGVLGLSRARSVRGGGASLGTPFGGAGARLEGGWARAHLDAHGALSFVDLATPLTVRFPDGSRSTVSGGSLARVEAGAAWRIGSPDSLGLELGGALFYERLSASDPRGYGLLPSHTWIGLAVDAGAGLPLGRNLDAEARVGIVPLSTWQETPDGATGSSPGVGLSPFARVTLGWTAAPRRRWIAGATLEETQVSFSGSARAPFDPPLQGAQATTLSIGGFVGSEWRF